MEHQKINEKKKRMKRRLSASKSKTPKKRRRSRSRMEVKSQKRATVQEIPLKEISIRNTIKGSDSEIEKGILKKINFFKVFMDSNLNSTHGHSQSSHKLYNVLVVKQVETPANKRSIEENMRRGFEIDKFKKEFIESEYQSKSGQSYKRVEDSDNEFGLIRDLKSEIKKKNDYIMNLENKIYGSMNQKKNDGKENKSPSSGEKMIKDSARVFKEFRILEQKFNSLYSNGNSVYSSLNRKGN